MKLNHMVSRRNHLLNSVDTFWYYSALTFWSSVRGVIPVCLYFPLSQDS